MSAEDFAPDKWIRNGRVARFIVDRRQSARCRECSKEWANSDALAAGSLHAEHTGHVVTAEYRASYAYVTPAGSVTQ